MWLSRTKNDLIIEVWEKLDCESIGRSEIEAIEIAVAAEYGDSAVDSPMVIARLLADEGADLRHSEIMELYVSRASDRPYEPVFRNILKIDDLRAAEQSIRNLENLRVKYLGESDREGLRLLNETGREGKQAAAERAENQHLEAASRSLYAEIAQWFTIWLLTPAVFFDWLEIRKRAADFVEHFGPPEH